MYDKPVVLIGFQEQDNLGIGYLASVLIEDGFYVKIVDYRLDKSTILERIAYDDPQVVGVSIIFQYHIEDFRDLIAHLKNNNVNSHFTAGGHYPSISHKELFHNIPQLDSVVLFEGEYTFLELVKTIYSNKDWRHIPGIAFNQNGTHIVNQLRPLEKDLDQFPPPVRPPLKNYALGKKYSTILAGRGCVYNCSFCSIREFYAQPPGPIKRLRQPELVVREMELLYEQLGCSIFMFQDDDFPVGHQQGKKWASRFCDILAEKEFRENILWKINCRPDEVEADFFSILKDHGLFLVYLGIESGTDDGLRRMNKNTNAQTNFDAVNILKKQNIAYDYGFMLFDPWSTCESILDNLQFLKTLCGDGSSPITFCKMLPYAGTDIERRLRADGRLKGQPGFKDYDFEDKPLNDLYSFMADGFKDWIASHDGLLNTARWARYHSEVFKKFFKPTLDFEHWDSMLSKVVSDSNLYFIEVTSRLVAIIQRSNNELNYNRLGAVRNEIQEKHNQYKIKLDEVIDNIKIMAEKQAPNEWEC